MAKNETYNANLVREHFRDDLMLVKNSKGHAKAKQEEQSSTLQPVKEFLATASKKASGKGGSPDFIFTFSKPKDFIVLIECKADNKDHESKTLEANPSGKAVDGAIWYAVKAIESGHFNIALAVGTSGEKEEELKVSYYKVYRKGSEIVHELLLNPSGEPVTKLLALDKTLDFVFPKTVEERHKNDNKVRDTIHGLMRKSSLSEENKPLVLAGSLLALSDPVFSGNYKRLPANELGAEALKGIERYIKQNNLLPDADKRAKFIAPFSTIDNHSQLHISSETDENITYYRQILDELVTSDILNSLDPDIIADFYTEFLKYSGGDGKGLGIVLTPHHITDLFAHLGFVDKNSVFLDTCFGTGSFLNSALHVALSGVEDKQERDEILKKNVVGVELNPKMFTLGATNLLLRGVSIEHLFEGSCFDMDIVTSISELDRLPNVALINPPYALKKNGGKAEIEFIENACNALVKGGYVVALVPISTGGDTGITSALVKERILDKHTLYAVMSMPTDLFAGKAATNVQILVFKTGIPHKSDFKTWFANWSDDGYFIKKHVGRGDYNGLWQDRKTIWISEYTKRNTKAGASTLQVVSCQDVWVTEAYLKNDYTELTISDFKMKLKAFAIHALASDLLDFSKLQNMSSEVDVILPSFEQWDTFRLSDLFKISTGNYKTSSDQRSPGSIPLVSAYSDNNGISDNISIADSKATLYTADSITVAKNGSLPDSFYQPRDFVASSDVGVLVPKKEINKKTLMFIATIIKQQVAGRFSYGFKLNTTRLNEMTIYLPAQYDPLTNSKKINEKTINEFMDSLKWSSQLD